MKTIEQVYEKAARDAGYDIFQLSNGNWAFCTEGFRPEDAQGGGITETWKAACVDNDLSLECALDDFTKHYLIAALWSTNDESDESGGQPMDLNFDICDIAYEMVEKAVADCNRFQTENAELLAQAYVLYEPRDGYEGEALAGHDFWLNRNGYGTGFWDRYELGEIGNKLSEACAKFKTVDLYIGDDGEVHGS